MREQGDWPFLPEKRWKRKTNLREQQIIKHVFGIMGTKHCEKKDKPIIVFKHVKRSYRALDLTIHGELRRSTVVKLGMRTILLTSCILGD